MKVFKRNVVILTVLAFVCVAIYLNWSYGKKDKTPAASPAPTGVQTGAEASGLYYGDGTSQVSDYFAAARLSRGQARDSAVSGLNEAMTAMADASQETKDETLRRLSSINETALAESELETLIKARGFDECVVFLDGDGATVTVSAPETGLESSEVARIADVVLQKTDLNLEQLHIVEVK